MVKILVSECLYGGRTVRYDGADVPLKTPVFLKWKEEGRLVPVCPEVCGGLPIPRESAERRGRNVFTGTGKDVTREFRKGAEEALRAARAGNVGFCVMKANSPSCGSREIFDGTFTGRKIPGEGLAVELLREAGFTVFSECESAEAADFLSRLEEPRA